MINEVVSLSFSVSKIVADNLSRRAAPMNLRASEYARRLFEAAYAASVAIERGEETSDRALERQVRDVFLLADCEPEFIADALGLPTARVQKILDGWRQVARELRDAPRPAAPVPAAQSSTPLPPPATTRTKPSGYSAEEIGVIRAMWREGKSIGDIAEAIGRPTAGLQNWASRHRDVCPARRGGR